MDRRDFRSLNEDTQAELRRLALRKLDQGLGVDDVAEWVEVNTQTVRRWKRAQKDLQSRDFKGKKRGRTLYEQRILSKEQEKKIQKTIRDKTPDQIGLSYALWNRKAIKALIDEEVKTKIRMQTVSKYTKRWGLTPQRPNKYATEQDSEKIRLWLEEEYPKIVEKAKEEGGEIHWEDETGIALHTWYARTYAKKGKNPTVKLPAKKISLSVISSITNQSKLRFMIYKKALDSKKFIKFLKRLIKDSSKKIFLIADNLRVDKSKEVKKWQEDHKDMIEIFFPTRLCSTVQPR